MQSEKTPRYLAYQLLLKMENKAYSNLALNSSLSQAGLKNEDKAFLSRLFYGVIERKITLDHIISNYSKKPMKKLDLEIAVILRMGLYQLLYMDSVPDNAAVNESAELAKKAGKSSAAGLVNAILRGFIRDGKKIPPSNPQNLMHDMEIKYSTPLPLIKSLLDDYGEDDTTNLLSSSFDIKKTFIRVNIAKITPAELVDKFAKIGINADIHPFIANCLTLNSLTFAENNPLFKEGFFHIQDLSSQICCLVLDPQKDDLILDICAAPGGKSFTAAQSAKAVYACDISEKRTSLIEKGAKRLGLSNIKTFANDARVFNENYPLFDKILCDVPCSGFGVIGQKPEIKYKDLSEISALPAIQYEILKSASKYLKPGGELVYSTCTLSKKENDNIVDKFLTDNKNFKPANFTLPSPQTTPTPQTHKATIFPRHYNSEGFFIAKIKRED